MRIDKSKDALIIVDVQPDFLPGGSLAVAGGDAIVRPIAELAARFGTVVATQDWHPRGHVSFASSHAGKKPFETMPLRGEAQMLWPDHCVAGTDGARLHPALSDEAMTLILRKGTRSDVDSYSAFRENKGDDGARMPTGLGAWLKARGITRVFITGIARDVCVRATALDAVGEGFTTVVIDDLTRAVGPERAAEVDRAFSDGGVARANAAEVTS
jgi:nicotinamidase/pyrazinamidase